MAIVDDFFGSLKPSITAILMFLFLYAFFIYPLFFAPLSHVPGPVGCKLSWYYIACFDVRLKRNDQIAEWHKKYGPVVCIRPGEVSLSSPLLMREIYGTKGRYTKSNFFDHFMAYGAKALFSIGPYWEHQQKRMLISTFYHRTAINKPVVELSVRERMHQLFDQINLRLQAKADNRTIMMYPIFNCFAFDNISRLLYGPRHCAYTIENDCQERQLLLQMKQAQLWGPLKFNLPIVVSTSRFTKRFFPDGFRASLSAEHDLADWNWRTLTEAIEDKEVTKDHSLLARMLAVKDKDGQPLELNYIASELFDHLNAAQETVAVALVYVSYHLAIRRDWQAMIRKELQALLVQEEGFPSFAAIEAAPLFEAFIREVHRINPGASGRQERYVPDGGKEYDGIFLPQGVRVSASTIALHHDETVFPSPEVFNPSRWLDLSPDQLQRMERSFIPFGYGARMCLGKALATMEIKLLVACLCLRYEMEVDSSSMTPKAMWQTGTMDSVPHGLRCDLILHPLKLS